MLDWWNSSDAVKVSGRMRDKVHLPVGLGCPRVQAVSRWSRTFPFIHPPAPPSGTMREEIKVFSVWMRNKCCFDRDTSGQASLLCPRDEPETLLSPLHSFTTSH